MKIKKEEVNQEELTKKTPKKKAKKAKEPRDIRSVFRKALSEVNLPLLKKPWMSQKAFKLISTVEDLKAWVDSVLNDTSRHISINGVLTPVIALDTETMGLDTRILVDRVLKDDGSWELTYEVNIELAGICLSSDGMDGIYIPVNHEKQDQELFIPSTNIDRSECAEILQYLFDRSHLVFYNAKFDREVLRLTMGINFRPYPYFEDVQVLAYINDPKADLGDKGKFTGEAGGLKALSKNVLGIDQIELDEIAKVKADYCPVTGGAFCRCDEAQRKANKHTLKNQFVPFSWIPTDIALWYAAGDAICTWLLWKRMYELARSRKLIHSIDHELVESITWIERQRWLVDIDRLSRTVKGHSKKLAELRAELRRLALEAGYEEAKQDDGVVLEEDQFNPGSTMQLQTLFFKVKGYTVTKFTDAGNPSCDADVLEDLFKEHPEDEFLKALLAYRDYLALHPDNLRFDPRDHTARIYLKQNVVAGGRLAAAGGDFERDGGFGLNPQGIKKVEGHLMWKVQGNVLNPDPEEIDDEDIVEYSENDLHPSCFKEVEKEVVVGYKQPNQDDDDLPSPLKSRERQCLELELTPEHWKEAARVAALHLERKDKYARRNPREYSKSRDYEEALRVATDGLVCELALHKQHIPYAPWNAYDEDTTLSDIGDKYEVRSYNCMTNDQIRNNWENLGYDMQEIKKDTYSFDFIRTRGHVEIYAKDVPERYCTFVVIVSPTKAYIVGGISIAEAQKFKEDWARNPQYLKTKCEEDKLYWTPVSRLQEVKDCPWYKASSSSKWYPAAVHEEDTTGLIPVTEKRKVKKKAPGIVKNHIGKYMGYAICLVPGCTSCAEKYGILIPNTKMDANEVINLRCLFYAPPGWTLFTVDYSNIEMRCAANVSGEPEFINEFLFGKGDFHSLTASKVFPEFNDPNTSKAMRKSYRDLAKIINFALLYGGTEYTIFENMKKKKPDITWEEAKSMVAKYWDGVPVFFQFCNRKQTIAKNEMLCKTATGRIISFKSAMEAQHIHIPCDEEKDNYWSYRDLMKKSEAAKKADDMEKSATYRSMADKLWKDPETGVRNYIDYNKFMGKIQRVSVNVPLQGLAGDFMRMSLNRIRKWVESEPIISQILHLHCSVHDEIDFIVKNEYVPFVLPRITRLMKLRKLHEKMGWKVPIESDAEYGNSWDVEHHVTGDEDHKPAAWTEIKGMENYIPEEWDIDTLKNLIRAVGSNEPSRVQRAKTFLEDSLHPRAFVAAQPFFTAQDDKSRKKALIAALQLDEYWKIDNTPDDEDDKLESMLQYEQRNGLGEADRDSMTPPWGFLGAIPLSVPVKRPTIEILGEPVFPEQLEIKVSENSIQVFAESTPGSEVTKLQEKLNTKLDEADDIKNQIDAAIAEVEVEQEKPKAMAATASSTIEESVFAETPVIRKKMVEQVVSHPVTPAMEIPNDGKPTYELVDLDDTAATRLRALLGSGHHTIRVLYRGRIAFLRNKAMDSIPEGYFSAVHGVSQVLNS